MKSSRAESNSDLFNMVEALEQDIGALKLTILKKMLPQTKKPTSLKGALKGIDITDQDIKAARKALYGKIGI
jgi:hypothetical protein